MKIFIDEKYFNYSSRESIRFYCMRMDDVINISKV